MFYGPGRFSAGQLGVGCRGNNACSAIMSLRSTWTLGHSHFQPEASQPNRTFTWGYTFGPPISIHPHSPAPFTDNDIYTEKHIFRKEKNIFRLQHSAVYQAHKKRKINSATIYHVACPYHISREIKSMFRGPLTFRLQNRSFILQLQMLSLQSSLSRVIILKISGSSNGNVILSRPPSFVFIHEEQMEQVFHYLMKKIKKRTGSTSEKIEYNHPSRVCSHQNAEHVCGSRLLLRLI